jgi:aryl-alcohol dehydrogenase-like predicted oxidoreductase
MTFGEEGTSGARVHDLGKVGEILGIFQKHGHDEIDLARVYGAGTSEEYLGKIGWKERGLRIEMKLYSLKVFIAFFRFALSVLLCMRFCRRRTRRLLIPPRYARL